jgi:hypothetical protein
MRVRKARKFERTPKTWRKVNNRNRRKHWEKRFFWGRKSLNDFDFYGTFISDFLLLQRQRPLKFLLNLDKQSNFKRGKNLRRCKRH